MRILFESQTFPFLEKNTEHTSAPSWAWTNVLMQRPLTASHSFIEPSQLPEAYNFAVREYFSADTPDLCCCDGMALTKHWVVCRS